MENESVKECALKNAFLIDPSHLKNLQTILSKVNGQVEYRVRFSDGSTVKYSDVEQVISQPNAPNKSFVGFGASVANESHSILLTMRGDVESSDTSIEYKVTGTETEVDGLARQLEIWIASCNQLYSVFYTTNLKLLLGFVVFIIPVFLTNRVANTYPPGKGGWHSYLPAATLVGVSVIEYWILRLFPRATFAIGYGARRNLMFNVLRVSVLLAILVRWLADGLKALWHLLR
jgi:hypothetical protein